MGGGRPQDILAAVARGVRQFDCVLPTRNGRNAFAFTAEGVLRLRMPAIGATRHRSTPTVHGPVCRQF